MGGSKKTDDNILNRIKDHTYDSDADDATTFEKSDHIEYMRNVRD